MKIIIITLIVGLMILAEKNSFAADTQFWNTYSVEKTLTKPWRISVEEELRIGEDVGKLIYYHTDFGIIHSTTDWLELGINYQYIRGWKRTLWENENRPHFNATLLAKWKLLKLTNRNRMENRFLSDTKDFWRYRNKTKIQLALEVQDRQIQPYISEEYFMDFDQPEFNFNRLAVGLEAELTKNILGEIYYLRQDQDDRGIEPKADVFGLALNFDF
jgi:hypothetical protein